MKIKTVSNEKDLLQQQYSELLLFTSWRNEKLHFWSNKTDEENSQDLSPDDPVFTKKLQTMFTLNEYEWEKNREAVIPFSNKVNCNDLNLIEIGINLRNKLDNLYENIKIDTVIIENQISQ